MVEWWEPPFFADTSGLWAFGLAKCDDLVSVTVLILICSWVLDVVCVSS